MQTVRSTDQPSAKGKGGLIALVVGCLVLIVVLGAIVVFLLTRQDEEDISPQPPVASSADRHISSGTIIDDRYTPEEIEDASKIEMGYIEVSMSDMNNMVFDASSMKSVNVFIENSAANSGNMYFDIVSNADGTVLYSSPELGLGEALGELVLDVELEPGTYPCTIEHHLIDPDTKLETGTLDLDASIIVK